MPGAEDLRAGMIDDSVELDAPLAFNPGDKVRARQPVRNDGSFPGRRIGEELIAAGETGYVRNIGTFLQRYFIYEVDFLERGLIVGMRAKELERLP
jgi:nitrogen fixation protein NifZ